MNLNRVSKRLKYPNVPERALLKRPIRVNNTNSLTEAVKLCLELHGCYVTRIQSQGQWNPTLKRFTRSTTKKGTADLHAAINGRHVSIEIKWGKDKLSPQQKQTARQVEEAGGLYLVVGNYDTFWTWFEQYAPDLVNKIGGELV